MASKVTKTEYGKLVLYDAIGSMTKEQVRSMVYSPVKEDNYKKFNAGERVNPVIRSILGAPNDKKIQ